MKKCSVCESEIRTDLEEFGDPKEPVCSRCWLEDRRPEEKFLEIKNVPQVQPTLLLPSIGFRQALRLWGTHSF